MQKLLTVLKSPCISKWMLFLQTLLANICYSSLFIKLDLNIKQYYKHNCPQQSPSDCSSNSTYRSLSRLIIMNKEN